MNKIIGSLSFKQTHTRTTRVHITNLLSALVLILWVGQQSVLANFDDSSGTNAQLEIGCDDYLAETNSVVSRLSSDKSMRDAVLMEPFKQVAKIIKETFGRAGTKFSKESKEINEIANEMASVAEQIQAQNPESKLSAVEEKKVITDRSLMQMTRQALLFPKTIREIHDTIKREFAPEVLDQNLWAFIGFHQDLTDKYYRQRPWTKSQVRSIGPQDIYNMSQSELTELLTIAMEIEDPIMQYSFESGNGLRFVLPNLGRFMGKNEEQAKKAEETGKWCESAWCAEERRHGNALAQMIEKLSLDEKVSPVRDNPNEVDSTNPDEAGAIRHLLGRNSTEWSASSAYVMMSAHMKGELKSFMYNIMRDEIKHLTVVGSAYHFLFGYTPAKRMKEMLRKMYLDGTHHAKHRNGGGAFFKNPVTLLETTVTFVLMEYYFRRYLRTLPYQTLKHIFENQSQLEALEAVDVAPEILAQNDVLVKEGRSVRDGLTRWPLKQRENAFEQIRFAEKNSRLIEHIINYNFNGFKGAELYSSSLSQIIQNKIPQVVEREINMGVVDEQTRSIFIQELNDRLRDYQIRNNLHVTKSKQKDGDAA